MRVIYLTSTAIMASLIGYFAFKTDIDFYLRLTLFVTFIIHVLLVKSYYKK
ncbi:hypothetical protein VME0621_03255 [Vibrio mediterranei]|nr:hypothetical protein VME0621_03255 [Vibrio mediterranei]